MSTYLFRRAVVSIPVLIAMITVTFLLVHALPGGPFDTAGGKPQNERMIEIMETRWGLDEPVHVQLGIYFRNLFQGDLGPLFLSSSQTVNDVIAQSFPVSIQLGVLSLLLGFGLGVPLGIIAALNHNSWVDHGATLLAVIGVSIPNLVLGPVLILIFGVSLDWLPIAFWGADPPFILGVFPQLTSDFWLHAVLPVVALGTGISAGVMRLTRAGLLEILGEDYIRTAHAKGLRQRAVILVHALKNSLIPVATTLGPLLAGILTGAFVIEQIFALNGLGRHFVNSVAAREYFLLTSLNLIFGVLLIGGNILVDILYAWLDPRIRFA